MKYVAKRAVGFPVDEIELERIVGSSHYIVMRRVVGTIASRIVENRDGLLYCGICGRGTYTRRGLYLHLIRVHREEIMTMIEEEYERIRRFYRGIYNG